MLRHGALLIFAALALTAGPTADAQALVSAEFDCRAIHPYDGFGVDLWPLPDRLPALQGLLQDLKVNLARWEVLPDIEKARVPDGLSFGELTDWVERAATPRNALWFAFYNQLRSLGVQQLAVSWRVPRVWLAVPGKTIDGKLDERIADHRVEPFARLLAAQLAVLKRHGIVPYAIELLNEPENKVTPAQYARLARAFLAWRDREGLRATRLAGPGTGFVSVDRRYLDALVQSRVNLDIVTTHAWDGKRTGRLTGVKPLLENLPDARRPPVFVTEYGIDETRAYRLLSDEGEGYALDGIPFGVAVAAQTLALYGDGANAAFYWEAQDPPWAARRWGLLDSADRPRPAASALRTIIQPLQVGDGIASTIHPNAAPPAALFVRGSRFVLEIANPDAQGRAYSLSFGNCASSPLAVSQTVSWPPDRPASAVETSGGGLQLMLLGRSVAAITLRPR